MITRICQHLDIRGLFCEGYGENLLDLIKLPEGVKEVAEIILAEDSGVDMMVAHFEPLTDDELTSMDTWWTYSPVTAYTSRGRFDEIEAAAKKRWPEVRVFKVPGCLCCNGTDNLLEMTAD